LNIGPKLPRLDTEDVHEDETRNYAANPDLATEVEETAEDVTDYAIDESQEATKLQTPDPRLLAATKPPIPREEP
jgi:hypothetical protein